MFRPGKRRVESDFANERDSKRRQILSLKSPVVQGKPESIDWTMNVNINDSLSNFMEQTFTHISKQLLYEPEDRSGRIYRALDWLGWKVFTICAHAAAFRSAIEYENGTDWNNLLSILLTERRSIEIFARTRDLEWRGPLLSWAGEDWPGLSEALAPEINLATEHPHHVVQTESGGLRRPMFPWDDSAKSQVNIKGNFFVPGRNKVDRLARSTAYASDFIELREFPGQGAGTRALTNFPDDMWLDQLRKYPSLNKSESIMDPDIGVHHVDVASPPLLESTVGEHFAKVVAEHGDRTAVISKHQNDRVTYASLDAKSNALARGLESVGVRKGERVGVMLGNSMEYAVATYALFKLGAILVPLNPSFNSTQVISALSHLEASHLIISAESNLPRKDPRSNVSLLEHMVEDLSSSKLQSVRIPSLEKVILVNNSSGRVDISSYKSLTPFSSIMSQLPGDGRPLPEQNLSPQDIVNIQFTSGTTAMPKAACLSHRSILNNGSQIGDRMLLTPKDIVCCPPPMFHCFGSILGYMATATHGSALVFPTESFNARAALQAVQEEKCTALYGVPTMFLEELSLIASGEVSGEGFQYLRTGIAAGSSIPAELMKRLHKILNLTELTICYGMTETSPVSAMTATNDPIDKRISTVGKLMPHVEAKVVSPEDSSRILPTGIRGELAVSGYLLMKEYWGDPTKTTEVMIPDKTGKIWMHTGDEASISEDAHPGVIDVSVVGVPDEQYGEVVAAFIFARDQASKVVTAEEIQQWVREKLSNHLVPKYVFFLNPTDTFPKTAKWEGSEIQT
ncbi:hypothetical protein N7450_005817 [Penicillium hetheringtonii]|uniref:AMP-dependent synthetase/ligase domain-containing protein n=1 Tax=Penicillium hetheringtonii TaxID=911720 RepID=A0AAD6DJ77_9EURO|nr:hypothetical protein N7450_005817 [Penicillium hetheringtonii]